MSEAEEKEQAQALALFGMLNVAVILLAITIGLFFGARWSFAFLALYSIVSFARVRRMVRRENKENKE